MSRASDLAARDKDLLEGTPARGDRDQSFATTEFVSRQSGNYSVFREVGVTATLTVDDCGGFIGPSTTSAQTITMPLASACLPTDVITIMASSGGTTILAQGSDVIATTINSGASISIPNRTKATFRRRLDNTGWSLDEGDAALPYSATMLGPYWQTPPQSDNTKKLATTEFVRGELGNHAGMITLSTSTQLTSAHIGRFLVGSGGLAGQVITMPLSSSVPAGSVISISGGGAPFTLSKHVSDANFSVGTTLLATIPMESFDSISLVSTGTSWRVFLGNVVIGYQGNFAANKVKNGWQKLPSGLIIQWGSTGFSNSAADVVENLPITFPTEFLHINLTQGYTAGTGSISYAGASPLGNNQFNWRASLSSRGYYFLAVGY